MVSYKDKLFQSKMFKNSIAQSSPNSTKKSKKVKK